MDMMVWIWLAGIIAFVILEAATYQLVSVWFAVGAIGGLIANAVGASFAVQMIVFIIVSVACVVCLRPVSKKLLKVKETRTNVDALAGKDVLITEEVKNLENRGKGVVNGMEWTVRSSVGEVIEAGEVAVCERVEGVKLIVKRKEV